MASQLFTTIQQKVGFTFALVHQIDDLGYADNELSIAENL